MIIDNKGRLFGKISFIDLSVVLVIIFLVFVFAMKNIRVIKIPIQKNTNTDYTVTLKIYSLENTLMPPVNKGERIYSDNDICVGEIVKVDAMKTVTKQILADGTYANFENPRYNDFIITVKGSGSINENGVFAQGKFLIMPNKTISVNSKYFGGSAVVLTVEKSI